MAREAVALNARRSLTRLLQRACDVRDGEVSDLLLACGYFFCLLSAWFIMRPIREQVGVAGGTRNLPWLYTGTLLATLAIHPPFAPEPPGLEPTAPQ